MIDREKVIQGLKCCTQDHCDPKDCPYWEHGCEYRLKADALELLRMEQLDGKISRPHYNAEVSNGKYCGCCVDWRNIQNDEQAPKPRVLKPNEICNFIFESAWVELKHNKDLTLVEWDKITLLTLLWTIGSWDSYGKL